MADFVLIVTGGRKWQDEDYVFRALDAAHARKPVACVVEGGCPTGVDLFARRWAKARGVRRRTYPAKWKEHGRAAGPIRNREMRDATYGADRAVAAFPGGDGTADCVRVFRAAGVPVWDVAGVHV